MFWKSGFPVETGFHRNFNRIKLVFFLWAIKSKRDVFFLKSLLQEMIEGVYLAQDQPGSGYQGDQDDCNSLMLPRTLQSSMGHSNGDDYGNITNAASPYSNAAYSPAGRSTSSSTKSKGGKPAKCLDKDSDEYKRRRTLNNIAVKKSREKAKAESRATVQRLQLLTADKERLERRVDQLTKEIQFLHGLFSKFNDIPEPVKAEVARAFARLQMNHR